MSDLIEIRLPKDAQEGTQSMIGRWLKNVGDTVALHEPILEISTDKVSVEISSPGNGVLKEILKNENDEVKPGELVGKIEAGAAVSSSNPSSKPKTAPAASQNLPASQDLSPAVRKLLKDNNLEASQLTGTGKDGRITHQDVTTYLNSQKPEGKIPSRLVKHSAMRKSIALHMAQSLLHSAPHVTSVFECDMSKVIAHRESHKVKFEKEGLRLTLSAYFVQAACDALAAVPEVNSRWHEDGLEIFEDFNIGIATALEDGGLVVPVIHRAQCLDLAGIAKTLEDLTSRARSSKLETKDVQAGTFTISNHGVSGSLFAAPIIINQPQSAILGIGKLEKRICVVEENGKESTKILPKLYVTLTIDHRVLDGYKANSFLTSFVKSLQQWQ